MQCSHCLPLQTKSLCETWGSGCFLFVEECLCSLPWHLHWKLEEVGVESQSWHQVGKTNGHQSNCSKAAALPHHCHISPFHPFPPGGEQAANRDKVREAHPLASSGAAHRGRKIHLKSCCIRPDILLICKHR